MRRIARKRSLRLLAAIAHSYRRHYIETVQRFIAILIHFQGSGQVSSSKGIQLRGMAFLPMPWRRLPVGGE